jgi:hypothetical protein
MSLFPVYEDTDGELYYVVSHEINDKGKAFFNSLGFDSIEQAQKKIEEWIKWDEAHNIVEHFKYGIIKGWENVAKWRRTMEAGL